ncbi:MAG: hypothetical protein U1F43_07940 [Myxococcota bacterium]
MATTELADSDKGFLEEAAADRFSGLDLRFEGGPYIDELERLVDQGYLRKVTHEYDYMVSYFLTDVGREAIGR